MIKMNITKSQRLSFLLCLFMVSSCTWATQGADVCFNPGGNCLETIAAEIGKAQTEILIQAHTLNAKLVADAVVKAKESGVAVEIILDKSSGVAYNNATYFTSLNGIPTYIDAKHYAADSNVIIIDKETLITGSFNLAKEAQDRNAQNVMILQSDRVAGTYIDNWVQHKNHSNEFKPRASQSEKQSKSENKTGKKKKVRKYR